MRSIVFVITNLQMGGAEKAMVNLANTWVETAKVSIIKFDAEKSYFSVDPRVNIVSMNTTTRSLGMFSPILNVLRRLHRLPSIIRSINPDVTIAFMDTPIMWTLYSKMFTRAPLMMVFQVTPTIVILKFPLKPLRRLFYKKADAAVVLTKGTFPIFKRLGIQLPAKQFVIPNSISKEGIIKNDIKRENIILGAGRLVSQKRFDRLIRIFKNLPSNSWQLWIMGEGEKRPELEALIKAHGLSASVKLIGAQKDVSAYYSRAKIFALSSDYEGFPVVLCEAMGNGCACISFDCETGPSDLIINKENGLLIEDKNEKKFEHALWQLMNDDDQIRRYSINARKVIDDLDIETLTRKWEAAAEEVINSNMKK